MYPNSKSFAFTITRIASRYKTELAQSFLSNGLQDVTPDYWIIIEELIQEDNITIGQLAKRTNKDNASITRIVDGMERNDLVNRIPSSNDKRSYHIVLTKYSRSIFEKLKEIEDEVFTKSTEELSLIEVKELIRMLDHLYEKLT